MRVLLLPFCISLFLTLYSCSQNDQYEDPILQPDSILKDLKSFLKYNRDYLKLSEDFVPLGTSSTLITKKVFFNSLSTGEYLPLRLISKNSTAYYKLYRLDNSLDNEIRQVIKDRCMHLYSLYKMEGQKFPDFNFIDLIGNEYNKSITDGKIVVLKCWFIRCVPCIEEMPALNDLKKQYENREDIIFLSLAFDSKDELKNFLLKHKFNYPVVPDQKEYITKKLNVSMFPTHFLLNKNGFISKVVNDYKDLAYALNKESLK